MTKNIRKAAPRGATMFCSTGYKVEYYKMNGLQLMKYVESFGWITTYTHPKGLHDLKLSPKKERLLIALTAVTLFGFITWMVYL